jgi:hypothetical protein
VTLSLLSNVWFLFYLNHIVTTDNYSKTCLNQTPLELKNFFSLDRFKLHRHLVDGTVKSVWLRQILGLLRVRSHCKCTNSVIVVCTFAISILQFWLSNRLSSHTNDEHTTNTKMVHTHTQTDRQTHTHTHTHTHISIFDICIYSLIFILTSWCFKKNHILILRRKKLWCFILANVYQLKWIGYWHIIIIQINYVIR